VTTRRYGIRAGLFGITIAATLPAMMLAGYVGDRWTGAEREALQEQLERRADAMATAVERRVDTALTMLAALAESDAMRRRDFATVYDHSSRLLKRRPGGSAVVLVARDGRQVFNTRMPFGTVLAPAYMEGLAAVFEGARPAVSDLFLTPSAGIATTTVSLPVIADDGGMVDYALRLSIDPSELSRVLRDQQLPADWIGVMIDRNGVIIARTRADDVYVGEKAIPELLAAATSADRGEYRASVKEGIRMEAAFTKVTGAGWTVAVGAPEAALEQPLWEAIRTALLGGAILLIAGFAASLVGAQAIERQAGALARAAKALGRGGQQPVPRSRIREFDEFGEALLAAADLLQLRDQERERERQVALAAKADAERANAAKSRFLASASHDLRQPFQAMRLFFEVLQPHVSPTGAVAAARLHDAMRAGEELLESLLDVSILDAGTVKVTIEAVPVAELLSLIAAECGPLAAAKGLRLRCAGGGAVILSDRVLLTRMVRNLVVNAIRYSQRGGVLLGCRKRNGRVLIQVWDTGIGIADSDVPHLFEDFFQVHNSERDRAKGLGLGLAVVARTGRLLGHRIEVRSRLGKGSVFTIDLAGADIAADVGA
jgi:signal transduction histidine kinase